VKGNAEHIEAIKWGSALLKEYHGIETVWLSDQMACSSADLS